MSRFRRLLLRLECLGNGHLSLVLHSPARQLWYTAQFFSERDPRAINAPGPPTAAIDTKPGLGGGLPPAEAFAHMHKPATGPEGPAPAPLAGLSDRLLEQVLLPLDLDQRWGSWQAVQSLVPALWALPPCRPQLLQSGRGIPRVSRLHARLLQPL